MFDRLSIRSKLIAIVGAPLAVLLLLTTFGYLQHRNEVAQTARDAARVQAIGAAQNLQYALQVEALESVRFLASGNDGNKPQMLKARETVDGARSDMSKALDKVAGNRSAHQFGGSALDAVAQLKFGLRPQTDGRRIDWTFAVTLYRSTISYVQPMTSRLSRDIDDGPTAQGARGATALGEYEASQADLGMALLGGSIVGRFPTIAGSSPSSQSIEATFRNASTESDIQRAVIGAEAGNEVRAQLRNRMVGGDLSFFTDTLSVVRQLPTGAPISVDSKRWNSATMATLEELHWISTASLNKLISTAESHANRAELASKTYLVGSLLAVLVAVALAMMVASSIARPLGRLADAVDHVATNQLPRLVDALRKSGSDGEIAHLTHAMDTDLGGGRELNRLSASVNQIQATAVAVATEQAATLRKGIGDMFINLARRNQGLLDRQLEFIDELEAKERDPDQLEHLFKLDHMATRMRRNAESLLVLAGAEPGRRRGDPVPLTKVALAAIGEIEHFARVELLDMDEADVISAAAADVAHLLSELMENATQFSPPDARVEVVGSRQNTGSYSIAITDQGIGMTADQLHDANALLAKPPALGLTLARTLGFIVVGRLSARHSIHVRIVSSPSGGVTALVTLPPTLVSSAPRPLDLSDRSASPASLSAGPSVDTPSSILPPFEYTTFDASEPLYDMPATLEEALPTGNAFEIGLDAVMQNETAQHVTDVGQFEPASSGLFGFAPPQVPTNSAEADVPRDVTTSHLFAPRESNKLDTPPPSAPGVAGGTHLFRPLPNQRIPMPPRPESPRTSAPAGPPIVSPNGLPARSPKPPAPNAAPTVPAVKQDLGEPVESAPQSLPVLQPPTTDAPITEQIPVTTNGSTMPRREVTTSGLVKRVPRAAGAHRVVPGSDEGSRATATSQRSPEEIRSMLARFKTGRLAGQAPGPAPSGKGSR